jgi:protein SCO1/2
MMRVAIAWAVFAVGILSLMPAGARAHEHSHLSQMKALKPLSGTSLYNLTSSWTDQDGKAVKLASLRGTPVVIAMAYTTCKDICPMIVADMVAIEDQAKEKSRGRIRFAFFSIDSVVDTPERLRAYAKDHGLDPADWTLYHGDAKAVRELAAALGVRYSPDPSGGFDHSAIVSLLDAEGNIVFQQPDAKLDPADMVKRIEMLPHSAAR